MSRRGKTVVAGHGLRHEGAPFSVVEDGRPRRVEGKEGSALCACGELSPVLGTTAARQRWHGDHKDRVVGQYQTTVFDHIEESA